MPAHEVHPAQLFVPRENSLWTEARNVPNVIWGNILIRLPRRNAFSAQPADTKTVRAKLGVSHAPLTPLVIEQGTPLKLNAHYAKFTQAR